MWWVVRRSCFAILAAFGLWGLIAVFAWRLLLVSPALLETHEVPARAPVIAVLVGDTYFRAEKAAALYFAGYGDEIWLTGDPRGGGGQSKRCLEETHHVPATAVRFLHLDQRPAGIVGKLFGMTFAELGVIDRELARRNMHRVILVTSRLHGRRTRALWDVDPFRWSRKAIIQHPDRRPRTPCVVTTARQRRWLR